MDTSQNPSTSATVAADRSRTKLVVFAVAAVAAVAFEPTRWVALTVAGLLVLVVAHEAGHLFAARRVGLAASEFSVGFGPTLIRSRPNKHGTVFTLRAIPAGGFVRLVGMDAGTTPDRPVTGRDWSQMSAWRRITVAVAGPAANIALTMACLFLLFAANGRQFTTNTVDPVAGGPAASAGIRAGDQVIEVDGAPVTNGAELIDRLDGAEGTVMIVVDRDGRIIPFPVTVDGGRVGVRALTDSEPLTPWVAAKLSASATVSLGTRTASELGTVLSTLIDLPAQLAGASSDDRAMSPIGAAQIVEETTAASGMIGVLQLIAVLSMFLAVFNLLPIPPLDGGHAAVTAINAAGTRLTGHDWSLPDQLITKIATVTVMIVIMVSASALVLDITNPL